MGRQGTFSKNRGACYVFLKMHTTPGKNPLSFVMGSTCFLLATQPLANDIRASS